MTLNDAEAVGAEAGVSHRADGRCGSSSHRHKARKWLTSASAPIPHQLVQSVVPESPAVTNHYDSETI